MRRLLPAPTWSACLLPAEPALRHAGQGAALAAPGRGPRQGRGADRRHRRRAASTRSSRRCSPTGCSCTAARRPTACAAVRATSAAQVIKAIGVASGRRPCRAPRAIAAVADPLLLDAKPPHGRRPAGRPRRAVRLDARRRASSSRGRGCWPAGSTPATSPRRCGSPARRSSMFPLAWRRAPGLKDPALIRAFLAARARLRA